MKVMVVVLIKMGILFLLELQNNLMVSQVSVVISRLLEVVKMGLSQNFQILVKGCGPHIMEEVLMMCFMAVQLDGMGKSSCVGRQYHQITFRQSTPFNH